MKQSIATFCSLALCLWGYQTGLWVLAIPMVMMLEGREFVRRRWTIPRETLNGILYIAALFWLLSIIFLPPTSPTPVAYAARYQLLRGLPVALFPLIVAQTYGTNITAFYQSLVKGYVGNYPRFNFYYPYFGICLLSASVTGGNNFGFLAVVGLLVTGVLWLTRSPRFSATTYYSLIGLALALSIIGAHQFYWLEANLRLPGLPGLSDLTEHIAQLWPSQHRWKKPLDTDFFENNPPLRSQSTSRNLEPPQSQRSQPQSESLNGDSASNPRESTSDILPGQSVSQREEGPQSIEAPSSLPDLEPMNTASNSRGHQNTDEDFYPSDSSQGNVAGGRDASGASDARSSSDGEQGGSGAEGIQGVDPLPAGIQQVGGLVDPETSQTRIGAVGALQQSNAILFRVTPLEDNLRRYPYPLRLREATYNRYQSGRWDAVNSKFFPKVSKAKNRWVLGPSTTQTLLIRISESLNLADGLLKLPVGVSEIQGLRVDRLHLNQYGAASFQRNSNSSGPLSYDVQFNPSDFVDSAPTRLDRAIPKEERKTLKTVLKRLDLGRKSSAEKVQAISAFFDQDFQYSLNLPKPQKRQTPLSAFLLDHRSGHCEYFASATSLLLRSAGIPTRYIVGYSVSEYSPNDQQYIVRLRDAHAWVMAYVDGAWITVDNTPSDGASQAQSGEATVEEAIAQQTPPLNPTGLPAPTDRPSAPTSPQRDSAQTGQTSSPVDSPQNQTLSQQPLQEPSAQEKGDSPVSQKISDYGAFLWDAIKQWSLDAWEWGKAKFSEVSESLWFGAFIVLGGVIALIAAVVIWKILQPRHNPSRVFRKRRFGIGKSEQKEIEYKFHHIEDYLESLSLQRHASETPLRWLKRLEQNLPPATFIDLRQILDLHYRDRFDPKGIDAADSERLQRLIRNWLVDFQSLDQTSALAAKKLGYPG